MLSAPLENIERRACDLAKPLGALAQIIDGETMTGGGSVPGGSIPTKLVAISDHANGRPQKLALDLHRKLRFYATPIIARIENNVVLLDPRTILPEEDEIVLRLFKRYVCHRYCRSYRSRQDCTGSCLERASIRTDCEKKKNAG
jgi:L-seryl-tRNA(Ser) seleniumtransferase